jgi:HAD superfamily hydrolase (TIGR01509 family)
MDIKNIIFDLGGVILNIDYNKTIEAFKNLGIADFEKHYAQAQQTTLFDDIETGKITPDTFFNKLIGIANIKSTNQELESAWNAMLLDLPIERIELLKKVAKHYNIYLLSNTNEIHYNHYIKYIETEFGIDFNSLFLKTYYSHKIGFRKPNKNCFDFVLDNNKLVNTKTLFIDDSIQHIEGATNQGINTIHLAEKTLLDLFDTDGLLIT